MLNDLQLVMVILTLAPVLFLTQLDLVRLLAYILMGLALSATSLVVYYRRAELLATESVHVGLFAVTLGYILHVFTRLPLIAMALPVGLVIVYATGLLVKNGFSIEKASALMVSTTTAFSVILIHYVLTTMPAEYSLSAVILGDPLLLTRGEALVAIMISLAIVITVLLFIKELISTSVDPISVSVLGVRVGLYDTLVYTIIGASTIGLLRLAGYVMEHVFILLPAIVMSRFSRSLRDHILNTILAGAWASSTGYALAFWLNTSPTGITGLLLVTLLVIGLAVNKR